MGAVAATGRPRLVAAPAVQAIAARATRAPTLVARAPVRCGLAGQPPRAFAVPQTRVATRPFAAVPLVPAEVNLLVATPSDAAATQVAIGEAALPLDGPY